MSGKHDLIPKHLLTDESIERLIKKSETFLQVKLLSNSIEIEYSAPDIVLRSSVVG